MIMLPAFKAVADELGKPVICIVSSQYAPTLDGVSYVKPWVVNLHWWKGVGQARKMAEEAGLDPIVVKWWDEPGAKPSMNLANGRTVTLKIHGELRTVPEKEWDSFQASQWRYAGFTMQQMMDWPLVFDRRNPGRELALRREHIMPNRVNLLVNLPNAGTSPFKEGWKVTSLLMGMGFNMINLMAIRSERIYDLLGLYDHAQGLITSDTATLHLAAASKIPYIALINNGGSGSIPRGNCVLSLRYSDVANNLGRIVDKVLKFKNHA